MEIAINSLLVFLLLVFPGLIFRRFYYVGEFSKQFNSANWLNSFYISIIPGIITQVLTLWVFLSYIHVFDDKAPLICYINSFYNKVQLGEIPFFIFKLQFLKYLFLYFVLLVAFAALLAQFSWVIVRQFKLDIKFKPLRFSNHWHYYFSGEIIKTKDFKPLNKNNKNKKVVLTEADVLVDLGNGNNKLYKGFISQYTICKDTGNLKTLYLTEARRFKITDSDVELKDIPGDIMVIPYDKILNFNLTYIYFAKSKSSLKIISAVIVILFLVSLMLNPFGLIFDNLTLFGEIVGRIWLFLAWALLITLISTYIDIITNRKKIKKDSYDDNENFEIITLKIKELKDSIKGAFMLLIFIGLILYFFFM